MSQAVTAIVVSVLLIPALAGGFLGGVLFVRHLSGDPDWWPWKELD